MEQKEYDAENRQRELELCMTGIKKDVEYIKKSLDEHKVILNAFIANASTKYALKYVEDKLSQIEKRQNKTDIVIATAYGALVVIYIVLNFIF